MKIAIIEDEKAGAENLKYALAEVCSDCEITAILTSVEAAVKYFQETTDVDLIFSDIQLDDQLAFDIFKQINQKIPVVFVTAYHQYAIEAFKYHGLDYVLKPFIDNDIKQALDKARTFVKGKQHAQSDQLANILSKWNRPKQYKSTFLVNYKDRLIPVETKEIAFFYKDEKTLLRLFTNDKYIINATLDEIENQLQPELFYRLNRQMIIRRNAIQDIRYYFNGRLKIKTQPDANFEVIVSKAKATDFKNWISN